MEHACIIRRGFYMQLPSVVVIRNCFSNGYQNCLQEINEWYNTIKVLTICTSSKFVLLAIFVWHNGINNKVTRNIFKSMISQNMAADNKKQEATVNKNYAALPHLLGVSI